MPALRSTLRAHPLATVGLIVLFMTAAAPWLRDASDRIDEMVHGDQYVRTPFYLYGFNFEIASLDSSAEAAGLRKGDLVLAVDEEEQSPCHLIP